MLLARRIATKAIPRAVMVMVPGLAISDGAPYKDIRGDLPTSITKEYKPRSISAIDGIIWHHTATSEDASLSSIAKFHIESNKWAGIAYHFAIDKEGIIYLCNDPSLQSNQALGHNSHTIGVALIGNYHVSSPSKQMEAAMARLQDYAMTKYDLKTSWYHGETKATACPGRYAIPLVKSMQFGPRPIKREP